MYVAIAKKIVINLLFKMLDIKKQIHPYSQIMAFVVELIIVIS